MVSKLEKLKLQLKWINQAEFAGIYVAKDKGYFASLGIDIEILEGGPNIDSDQQVANRVVDIGISLFDRLLVSRDQGIPLISIAQIVQYSTRGLITKRASGINAPVKMLGKDIGTFGPTDSYQLQAFLRKFNLENNVDVILQTSINDFLNNIVDVGSITLYNELQQIFNKGLHPNQFNIFLYESYGVGMVEDTLIVREDWLEENHDLAKRAVAAIIKGWKYAISHQHEAIDIVMKYVDPKTTTRKLQTKMLSIISNYISPPHFPTGIIGEFILPNLQRTADILYQFNIISKPANIREAIDVTIP
ncbi:ABC transporter substrate-binding protein [Bacillus toyonensis]|uniref:ABC transporter substrate-binding protein n=1 Tax=Bacillus toyonensis TaxID=155322 RepID=UPI0018A12EEE|nr:ABC transporter substrate-binding protein [Bacillus toyonensis]MBF7150804.1 ABC transporter substrate-binding protein [Bacillus toyonensis]MEC2350701.1 ABC transporter substrate-binding protein [Bacillus toyonensis]MED3188473.1 ABC transporter substrate-binding protein [Bacillus toyonensis]